jgi:NTP pyrophosphatase (non-canonical NTP hydrolase)
MTFTELQNNSSEWSKRNFGPHYGSGYRNLLGVAEEVGELCHAQLKGEQGIRHTPKEILKMKRDAVGDILIFLCNYCDSQGINMEDCAIEAWDEVKDRDWTKNKMTGKDDQ